MTPVDTRMADDAFRLRKKLGEGFSAAEKDLMFQGRTPGEAKVSVVTAAFMLIVEDFVSNGGNREIMGGWVTRMLDACEFPKPE